MAVTPILGAGLRAVSTLAPLVGLVPRPEPRPNGISAVVRVRGEEEWLEPCLRSIEAFADEIIVLDNGASQETADALTRLRPILGSRLRVEACPELDLFALSNRGLELARMRWVIRWDADFVARTEGEGDVARVREFLLGLDPRRYHLVYLPAAEVAGDLGHQFADRRIRLDGSVHTGSRHARYVPVERDLALTSLSYADRVLRQGTTLRVRFESLRVPLYFRVHTWPAVTYLHVDVKSRGHMLLRHFWLEWLRDPGHGGTTLEGYALARIRERWGIDDPAVAADTLVARSCAGLVPFDSALSGPYPAALRPYLDKPRYRVEYADGRIVGRSESC